MKIGIIGGGASGTFLAIRLKELRPDIDVNIFEKNDKLLKKITVTGNGKCNYANIGETKGKYNNDEFANKIIARFSATELINVFEEYGIRPLYIDNLVYPNSLTSQTVILMLEKKIKNLGINVFLNENVVDYSPSTKGFKIITNKSSYEFDYLVFASGGKAYPQLGTNGEIIDLLKKHNYQINELSPSLSPIKVKENTKKISGQRVKCLVSLFDKDNLCYQERGEVLFKDDGLSGIVILNISSRINSLKDKTNIRIVLDLLEQYKNVNPSNYIEYVHPKLAAYLIDHHIDIHQLSFSFKSFYPFEVAEVTHGGISLSNIKDTLESKSEKGVYFAGEILDVDGMCGGYNLMFAFASAESIAQEFKKMN